MLSQYIKQGFLQFRENRVLHVISLFGTSLSIAMILVLILVFQINLTDFVPESNRSRMLYVDGALVSNKSGNNNNHGSMSAEVLKSCLYSLTIPEAVTGLCKSEAPLSLPGRQLYKEYVITYTDAGYWQVFNHTFLAGQAFTRSDWESAIPCMVISEMVSQDLFGGEPAVGREILLDGLMYKVVGVVRDVPSPMLQSYSQVWVPYRCNEHLMIQGRGEGMVGPFSACLLAHSSSDFDRIQVEFQKGVGQYNMGKSDYQIYFPVGLLSQLDKARGSTGWKKVGWREYWSEYGILLLLFLLIPALNLSGILHSFMRRRRAELGVRRAFGATNQSIWCLLVIENFVQVFCGGLIGLFLSFVFLFACKSFLLNPEISLTTEMLFRPGLLIVTMLVVFVLNLLSVGIPTWWILREPIVRALHGEK